ncbi:MAG TPA: SDR family NAD(P)-dependent oxidoreductase [Planctomycetota bacterium]|nr:SDR family NAD(P)-dependent oxidoreductase [Planctomycetota bacterium]
MTGATGGIGRAVCEMLVSGGAHVGLLGRDAQKLALLRASLEEKCPGGRTSVLVADMGDAEKVRTAIAGFASEVGGLEVLVNNAGVLRDGALYGVSFRGPSRYPLEKWNETLQTNLTGAFVAAQVAVEHMLKKKTGLPAESASESRGLIINVSSISRSGRAGQSAYSASKGALVSLTATLAQELAPHRIRCVAVAPGLVDTSMAAAIPEHARKEMLARSAVGRIGRPEEIAHAMRFAIENELFNGRVIEIDGGVF